VGITVGQHELPFAEEAFEIATPTFLINLLKQQPMLPGELSLPETAFLAYEPDRLQVLPLLVQKGYLTIRKAETMGEERFFELDYPNREVECSFSKFLLKGMAEIGDPEMGTALSIGTINRATSEGNRHGQWATLLFTTPL
jgi:hypothetical protein